MAKASKKHIYLRLLAYLKPYRGMLMAGIIAGFLCGGSTIGVLTAMPNVIKPLTGAAEEQKGEPTLLQKLNPTPVIAEKLGIDKFDENQEVTFKMMMLACGAIAFFMILKLAATITNRFCMRWVGVQVIRDIRNQLFQHMQDQSLKFYSTSDIGDMISRVNNDTGSIEHAVSSTIADLTRAPIQIISVISFLIIFTIDKQFFQLWLFVFIIAPLVIAPIMHFSRRIKSHVGSALEKIGDLNTRMHEVFTGIRIVKAFSTEDQENERFQGVNNRYVRRLLRALRAELSVTVVLEAMNVTIACMVIVYCFSKGLTMADLMQLMMAALLIYEPSKRLAKVNTQVQRSMAAAGRIFQMLDVDTAIKEAKDPQAIKTFTDCVKFEDVCFAYNEGQPVLHNITFDMPKGHVVAFVGQAGCGKSTIANILGRFYDPDSGCVLIDGIDLRSIELASVRKLIGVVTQDTILFNDTIANNIAYGDRQVDMDRVIEAARRARAHDFICEREEGYDTVVGEKGFVLSGGQKQRVAIARALYKNPEILILDEATSALDSVTEQLVQEALNELMKDRTVFAIAHRLSTIRHANRIFVLEQGRIIEEGTHEELIALGGKYLEMNEIQQDIPATPPAAESTRPTG